MPKYDTTGRGTKLARERFSKAMEHVRERVPYGPSKAGMSAKEARKMLQDMPEDARTRLENQMGTEQWNKMMEGLYAP
jgi:hypothetical protein